MGCWRDLKVQLNDKAKVNILISFKNANSRGLRTTGADVDPMERPRRGVDSRDRLSSDSPNETRLDRRGSGPDD